MNAYPTRVKEAIETLRMIEEAVVADSLAHATPNREDMADFVKAQRYRIANAVRIFCAGMNQK